MLYLSKYMRCPPTVIRLGSKLSVELTMPIYIFAESICRYPSISGEAELPFISISPCKFPLNCAIPSGMKAFNIGNGSEVTASVPST